MSVRIAFVGVGGIAQTHLKALHANPDAELVAACDVRLDRAEAAAGQYGMVAYSDVDRMLEQEKPDALFLCVPPFAHSDLEEKAARRGVHLFVEKPLGLDMSAIRAKASVIREAGILAAAGYCLRYLDLAQQAKEYLRGKSIAMVRAQYMCGFAETPWWRELSLSGGQLVEQATHTVDMTRYLAGDIESVYARMGFGQLEDKPGATIASVTTVSVGYASGAIGCIDTTCIQPDWRSGVEIIGRDYRLTLSGRTLTILEGTETQTFQSETASYFQVQDDAFVQAVRSGDWSGIRSTYDDALETAEVTLAAHESAVSGQPVSIAGSRLGSPELRR
ncbi:Gfo/Idh/MocA family protein [Paenibacillus koleovorans]|uniref:Gfo/Idh/MocA family protein n=1 Tax=Paenibacillus koleovorans TaxID=121608 RepID=UPI000FDA4D3F|nr:Gfo/Idh/MocA family oxidoreductase [Paenibacillus koleovorans]